MATKPTKPKKPAEPIKPVDYKTVCVAVESHNRLYDVIPLSDIFTLIEERDDLNNPIFDRNNFNVDDLTIEIDQDWDDDTYYTFSYTKNIPLTKEEYEEELVKYNEKYGQYEERLENYKRKIREYNLAWDKYRQEETQREIDAKKKQYENLKKELEDKGQL